MQGDHVFCRLPLSPGAGGCLLTADGVSAALEAQVASLATRLQQRATASSSLVLSCRFCEAGVSRPLRRCRALPSPVLDDVSDYLLCYKQSALPLASDELQPRPGLALCAEAFVLLHPHDALAQPLTITPQTQDAPPAAAGPAVTSGGGSVVQVVVCPRCQCPLGERQQQQHDHSLDPLLAPAAAVSCWRGKREGWHGVGVWEAYRAEAARAACLTRVLTD